MRLINLTHNVELAHTVRVADTFFTRLKGLLGTAELPPGCCLVIKSCSSVHTFGMHYSIDVLFVDKEHQILKIVKNLEPGRMAACQGSCYVVEIAGGTIEQKNCAVGDILQMT